VRRAGVLAIHHFLDVFRVSYVVSFHVLGSLRLILQNSHFRDESEI
jgi:hypothetical protein